MEREPEQSGFPLLSIWLKDDSAKSERDANLLDGTSLQEGDT